MRMCGGGCHRVAGGQFTDDTEMAICLARGKDGIKWCQPTVSRVLTYDTKVLQKEKGSLASSWWGKRITIGCSRSPLTLALQLEVRRIKIDNG